MAEKDFSALEQKVYSGRGIIPGFTPDGDGFIGYSLTGRSPPSQARRLVRGKNTGAIATQTVSDDETLTKMFGIADTEKLAQLKRDIAKGNPALLLYPAVREVNGILIASNGVQTNLLYNLARTFDQQGAGARNLVENALFSQFFWYDAVADMDIDITSYEPDKPNWTSRISAALLPRTPLHNTSFGISRRSENGSRDFYVSSETINPGQAMLMTTYEGGNESPLMPFQGEPIKMDVASCTAAAIAESIYSAIGHGSKPGENYRVAAAAMVLNKTGGLDICVINRADRGE